jgi:glycogen synthase
LRKRTNMSTWQDKAIVAVVSRLTPQKGVHLIKHAAYKVRCAAAAAAAEGHMACTFLSCAVSVPS